MDAPKNFLMGIGNKLRADDGVGVFIAENFTDPNWFVCNCTTVPENYTSVVKKYNPEILVMVDAAQMNLSPGAFRRIASEQIQDVGLGTHAMSLSVTMNYLKPVVKKEIVFIGIQPKEVEDRQGLSEEMLVAAQKVMIHLRNASFEQMPVL
ncbi:hydrogenase 3 maturation endopeptidase HyCI [bacterium]|nr:hydrogenase 3 maturation endopeptidase HyCI [bacterium]